MNKHISQIYKGNVGTLKLFWKNILYINPLLLFWYLANKEENFANLIGHSTKQGSTCLLVGQLVIVLAKVGHSHSICIGFTLKSDSAIYDLRRFFLLYIWAVIHY